MPPEPFRKQRQPLDWYRMSAKGKSAEITIYEQIGLNWFGEGIGAKSFARDLKALGSVETITLRINSPGGSVFEGTAIYNILRSHAAHVHVIIDGIAASIASVIAMAGDTIEMPENAVMMIHNPSTCACGTSDEMRKAADSLDKIKEAILNTYTSRTGMSSDDVSSMMDDETWMTAKEALKMGFADRVSSPVKAVASASVLQAASTYRKFPLNSLNLIELYKESDDSDPSDEPEEIPMPDKSIQVSSDELDAIIAKAVAAQVTPQLQRLNEERAAMIRNQFANLSRTGNITPAQAKLFGSLADALMASDSKLTWSLDGDEKSESGTAIDALMALAGSFSNTLLQEQVDAMDVENTTIAPKPPTSAKPKTPVKKPCKFTPDMSNIPDSQKKCPSGFIMDQYIRSVLMAENSELTYADAAKLAEKDADLMAILDEYGYVDAK